MNTVTLDQVIDSVMQLPQEQQEMLLEIVHSRHIASRRRKIAEDARISIAAFQAGELRTGTAGDVVANLQDFLNDPSEE